MTCIFGMYFCDACSNMLHPYRANEGFLEFKCYVCGSQQIDFKSRFGEECMIYTKELQVGRFLLTQVPRSTSLILPSSSTPPCPA